MRSGLTLMVLLFSCAVFAQQSFVINGALSGLSKPVKVRLSIHQPGRVIRDSATTSDGVFTFNGKIEAPAKATLSVESLQPGAGINKEKLQFFVEPGTIEVKANQSIASAVIRGGRVNEEYQQLQQRMKQLSNRSSVQKSNSLSGTQQPETANRQTTIEDSFIVNHPDSYVSLDLVAQKWINGVTPAVLANFFDKLSDELKSSGLGKTIERIALNRTKFIFPEFALPDSAGNVISLASLKGRYVFVDIWASWCKPCRAENPHILAAVNQFKNALFDVLAISMDADRKAWLRAVNEDGMPWKQVRDAQTFQGRLATELGISYVPRSFLLDPEGKVIAMDLRGDALAKKLEEIFGK